MKGFVDPASYSTDAFCMLRPDGTLDPDSGRDLDIKEDDLLEMYRLMVLARIIDQESSNLQRQGELGVYTPLLGQEAAQIGGAYALDAGKDWIFPSYRELGPALMRGIDPADVLHLFRGTVHGGAWDFRAHRFAPYSVPVGTQALHGAGFAIACKLRGDDIVTMAYFGDGATSEGDVHEGLNFGGVWKAPIVYFCQNNQLAISVPFAKQCAAPTIAVKALGYGFPGVRVDGNDVLAVYTVTQEAVRRARAGDGPTLIEALTTRLGPHSTADDPTRYQTKDELAGWKALDPIERYKTFLTNEGILSAAFDEQCVADAKARAKDLRSKIVGAGAPPAEELFDHVYSKRPAALDRQLADFKRYMDLHEGE